MGIHLFLGYALGATDLHGENIIAHGEYHLIIDMETYPGYLKQQSEKDGSSVEEKISKSTEIKLANSVYIQECSLFSHGAEETEEFL